MESGLQCSSSMAHPIESVDESLSDHVSAFEEAVVTAIVPGELESWCRGVAAVLSRRRDDIAEAFDRQTAALEAMAREDPELLPRAENMQGRLASARASLGELEERLGELEGAAGPRRDSSAEPTKPGETLRDDLLSWIVGLRALDQEILTWYHEAVTRDRGVVD